MILDEEIHRVFYNKYTNECFVVMKDKIHKMIFDI